GERLLLRHAELQEAQDQLEVLERATRQDWSQASNFVDLGRYQLLRGELEAAAASFDEALRRDARSTEALLGLARAALEAGDPVAAERHLARLIDIDPQHGEGLFFLGLALHTQRRYEEARDALGRSRAVRPWGAAELHFLGNAFFQGGQLADAELAYRQALEAEPALADARYKLALLAFERGNMEAALTELSAYLDLERGGARAWVLEGIVLYRLGRSAEADDAFRRALDRIAVTATSREQVNGAIDAFSSLPDSQAALDRLRELRAGS
ncbi:MAG: tetratricopeptide repeat protein, partial [Thermoanaerobaculia bacterium]|nr:tetratricopeptide repeat protein [Thermoanaerobaculia bacterium]